MIHTSSTATGWSPPGGWGAAFSTGLGIEAWRIPIVIASAVGIYLIFLLFVRFFGPRILGRFASFDAVVIIMFGAVAGRVIIGHPPTLTAGAIGLFTLMCMEALFGTVQHLRGIRHTLSGFPIVVVAHGQFIPQAMRHAHLSRANVIAAARRAGLTSLSQAACIILEPTGDLSVIRAGTPIQPELLDGVLGQEIITSTPPSAPAEQATEESSLRTQSSSAAPLSPPEKQTLASPEKQAQSAVSSTPQSNAPEAAQPSHPAPPPGAH